MLDLIAQGADRKNRWRRPLPTDQTVLVGRASGVWSVPWDDKISRQHIEVRTTDDGEVTVRVISEATNPVFYRGQRNRQFTLRAGESFVIGSTTFTLTDDHAYPTLDVPRPFTERTYSHHYLRQLEYRHSHQRFDVLSRLPELLARAQTEREWFVQLVNVLLSGIPRASAAAVVETDVTNDQPSTLMHWDRAGSEEGAFTPSEKLIRSAVERQESVVHAWKREPRSGPSGGARAVEWAFCTPITGGASRGWALYVAGHEDSPAAESLTPVPGGLSPTDPFNLQDDLKFAELVASIVGSVRQLRWLERRQATLSQCFSPVVVEALSEADPESVLAPRETTVSVLFCDLRGFTRRSEQAADDLFGLLARVSEALGVVTHHILEQRGVVGDFHGDAAMGFWGWPLAQSDAVARACQAAIGIRQELQQASREPGHPLANFQVGLGLATGRAVAGKIGTQDQVKVTVFGPVVNLAARLESMTKLIRAPVLIDPPTADYVRRFVPPAQARVRRLAIVRPVGLKNAVEVSELLPPEADFPQLSNEHIVAYEAGLEQLLTGHWDEAMEHLHEVPANDRAKDFLTVFIARHNRVPPDNWDGVIPLTEK